MMMAHFLDAADAAEVYPTDEWNNDILLNLTMGSLHIPCEEAVELLGTAMSVPSEVGKDGKELFSKNLKRSIGYF